MALKANRVGVRTDQVDNYGRITSKSFLQSILYHLPRWTSLKVWKNGTEQLLPVNTDEPVTSPIVADIQYPTDSSATEQMFTYRESPTDADGEAYIQSIKGNTIVWNQLMRGFDSAYWNANLADATFSNNTILCTASAAGSSLFGFYRNINTNAFNWKEGHVYYVTFDYKSSKVGRITFPMQNFDTNVSETNKWVTKSFFMTCPTNPVNSVICYKFENIEQGDTLEVKNAMIIDLTMMGISSDQFLSYFPLPYYQYDSGSLLSFNGTGIKTVSADETEEYTTTIPTDTYFPTGMKSAGTVYDEFTSSRAYTRVGEVDLGTLDWRFASSQNAFYASTPTDAIQDETNIKAICANYTPYQGSLSDNSAWQKLNNGEFIIQKDLIVTGKTALVIKDTSFNGATAFKTAMNGVMLQYELAEEIIEPTLDFGE